MPDLSIEDILELARPREEVARVCLDGRLVGRHVELSAKLDTLTVSTSLAGSSEARDVATEIRQVEEAMEEAKVPFRFAGISSYDYERIQARFPRADGKPGWDSNAGAAALIAACALAPKMTEEQATQLLGKVNEGAANELFNAAWTATTGGTSVPPSARASALTRGSGSK